MPAIMRRPCRTGTEPAAARDDNTNSSAGNDHLDPAARPDPRAGTGAPFVAQFERASPGSRVIALDLPGNGLRNQHVSPLNVRDMVEDCRAQLAHAGVAPPFHLLAMSLGGMVAVDWSAATPAR